ncbi:MAG TPA: polyprenyl diphosphate synthase [Candidatus Krumholzibacteria bacterium]|nr:polyprenyl diphosphate synthase [Candidatus Krumholzibacteria bacterium]HPD71118.1 polyprenyl diphosphate synthase [Candidatus Krumholzibacteria bacterium]HRY39182.1 polyprenyl diphosphate synthase [Candidatus Krumholzibacteria bacterium]
MADPFGELADEQLAARLREQGGLPRHIAIIMDGNGRWARRRYLPRAAGHRAGRHAVRASVHVCGHLGIEVLTLYTFSQENFNRPDAEVQALWGFLEEALVVERAELRQRGVRLVVSGEVDLLPDRARATLQRTIEELAGGDGLVLNLALAYGGRQEIVRAARRLAARVAAGELTPDQIDEDALRRGFYQPDLPDPDLVIRTSGECRLSNFLIWQAAYAELLISPVLWPDFRERQLLLAIDDFQHRERRFGGLPPTGDVAEPRRDPTLLDPFRWKRRP